MSMYTPDSAQKVVGYVYDAAKDFASSCEYEIQDGGDFLLISVDLASHPDDAAMAKLADRLREIGKPLPKRLHDYAWMINLLWQGTVVESIFADIQ